MTTIDMSILKEVPGYRVILKAVLKSQIQQLIEQLAAATKEESIILTASVADGTLSHLGSDSAVGFLEDHEDVKSQFLGYCLKSHHKKKQEEEKRVMAEAISRANAEAEHQYNVQNVRSFQSPTGRGRGKTGIRRHQPYPVSRPILVSATPAKLAERVVKLEHDHGNINQSAGYPTMSETGADDSESSSSTVVNEQGQEGLSLGADLSGLVAPIVAPDGTVHSGHGNQTVKLETLTESQMDELEITGVTPGRQIPSAQDWESNVGANISLEYDPSASGATGSQADLEAQQAFNCDDLQNLCSFPLPIEDDELAHVGDVKYGVRIPKDALQRCEKSAKSAEKLALNLVEFLLSPEELQTVTVYGNVQHKKVPMDENKRMALRSHIFSVFMEEDGKWEKVVKAVNDKIRKQRLKMNDKTMKMCFDENI